MPSFTTHFNRLSGVLFTDVHIGLPVDPKNPPNNDEFTKYVGIWDTGATHTCITKRVVEDCQLASIGKVEQHAAGGKRYSDKYLISIMLPHRVGIPVLPVMEADLADAADVLVGMDIINMGDFAVTNKNGNTVMSFRMPSEQTIDFTAGTNSTKMLVHHDLQLPTGLPGPKQKPNEPCECGSGKKYKRCCGRK